MAWQSPGLIVALVISVVMVLGFVVFTFAGLGMGASTDPLIFFGPFCGVALVVILIVVIFAAQGMWGRAPIPPPPPIQQPMVPAGQVGPIALNCPNCGAPPQNVDRFGVATCTYCNTRFLVR
jgi:hypothetical protein